MAIDIKYILKNERLVFHLQPIVSPNGREFFGMEPLICSIANDGRIIATYILFDEAANLCRTYASRNLYRKIRHTYFASTLR